MHTHEVSMVRADSPLFHTRPYEWERVLGPVIGVSRKLNLTLNRASDRLKPAVSEDATSSASGPRTGNSGSRLASFRGDAVARQTGRFGTFARKQQAHFRTTLSPEANSPTDDVGQRHGHLLAQGSEVENLFPSLRGPGGAFEFFAKRGIKWWTSPRSGDRPADADFVGPTRNLASSQICCVNFLLPLADVDGGLLEFARLLDQDVKELEVIEDAEKNRSLVEFEWTGWKGTLEGAGSRGSNATSLDALLVGQTPRGRTAYLIEWKYCEEYRNPSNQGEGKSGDTRRSRYEGKYNSASSSFNGRLVFDDLLYDPYYQLMRMVLFGDRALEAGITKDLQIDDFRVIVVCPEANLDYRQASEKSPLGKSSPKASVDALMQSGLHKPERLSFVGQETIVAALRDGPLAGQLEDWLQYHELRYGW